MKPWTASMVTWHPGVHQQALPPLTTLAAFVCPVQLWTGYPISPCVKPLQKQANAEGGEGRASQHASLCWVTMETLWFHNVWKGLTFCELLKNDRNKKYYLPKAITGWVYTRKAGSGCFDRITSHALKNCPLSPVRGYVKISSLLWLNPSQFLVNELQAPSPLIATTCSPYQLHQKVPHILMYTPNNSCVERSAMAFLSSSLACNT